MKKITNIRLQSHLLNNPQFYNVQDIVSCMGAIQAQDYNMAKWAIGVRSAGLTNVNIEEAFNKGEILRTHVMRPTWHFVAPKDIRWMLKLSAERIKATTISRDRDLEITEELYTKVNNLLEKFLLGNTHLTREEIGIRLTESGIKVDSSRMIHFMMRAEVEGIVCSGSIKGKKQTYALLEERVPYMPNLNKEEALVALARRYFISHSPASFKDFVWWSGLSISDARTAIALIKSELILDVFGDYSQYIHESADIRSEKTTTCHYLPAFDEYIISYADRTPILGKEYHPKAFTKNGIFYPIVVCNGNIVGVWKKVDKNKSLVINTTFFENSIEVNPLDISQAEDKYRMFLNQ